jgi:hypothetical protein
MSAKRNLTMYGTPAMKQKLRALAERNGCSVNFLIEACFRIAIQCFDGNTTDLIKMLAQQDAKPTKEHDLMPVTVQLAPDVYEGLQRLHSRTEVRLRSLRRS